MTRPSGLSMRLDLAALERLIGGNTQIEIELQQAVAAAFAKRHLKAVCYTETFQQAVQQTIAAIRRDVAEQAAKAFAAEVGELKTTGWDAKLVLMPKFLELLHKAIDGKIRELVDAGYQRIVDGVKESLEQREAYWRNYVERQLRTMIDKTIEERVQQGIADRLRLAAQAVERQQHPAMIVEAGKPPRPAEDGG